MAADVRPAGVHHAPGAATGTDGRARPKAPDLTATPPRPLDAQLDGYAWLPRMLDKARATLAGTAGDYMFGCPVDHTCMARLGVAPELILELARRHDDAGVLAALRDVGIPSAADAWFDAPAVEDELQATGSYLRVRAADTLPPDPGAGGRVFAGADHGAGGVTVVVIDAAAGERQPMHTHPTEEVVAVLEGGARFRLGRWQARIVRGGEVVRVPAGCAHAWESLGPARLSAVAAYAGGAVVTNPAGDSS